MSALERSDWAARLDAGGDYCALRPWVAPAIAMTLLALQIGPLWYATPDSTVYLSIARSLWSPEGPTALGSRHLYFSPGYPAILAPFMALGQWPFVWIGIVHWLLSLAVLGGVLRWCRPLGNRLACFVTTLTLVHTGYGIHFRRPLSETAFTAALVWAAVVLDELRTAASPRRRVLAACAGTLLLVACCLIRPNGLMAAPGFAAALVVGAYRSGASLRRAALLAGVIGGVAAAIFFVTRRLDDARVSSAQQYTYWEYLLKLQNPEKSMVGRVPDGVRVQICDFQRLLVPGMFKAGNSQRTWINPNILLALPLAVLVVLGWWRLMSAHGQVYVWILPFYLALNVLWAGDAATRYSLPMAPVVYASFAVGLRALWPQAARWALLFVAAHALAGLLYWLTIDLPNARRLNAHWHDVATLVVPIDRRESTAAWHLSSEETQLFRYLLDRDVRRYDDGSEHSLLDSILTPLERHPVWLIMPTVESTPPPGFTPVATSGAFRLFRAGSR